MTAVCRSLYVPRADLCHALPQQLCRLYVDRDELEDPILRDHAHPPSPRPVSSIDVPPGESALLGSSASGGTLRTAGRIGWTERVSSGRTLMAFSISRLYSAVLYTLDCGADLTSQAAQAKLVDLAERVRILPIVLDDIDVVRRSEDPSKGGSV